MTELLPLRAALWFLLWIFSMLLIGRIVVEFLQSLARDWRPRGVVVVVLESIFVVTDPPVKLLRRVIPTIPLGAIRLDLSILVLFLAVFILMQILIPS